MFRKQTTVWPGMAQYSTDNPKPAVSRWIFFCYSRFNFLQLPHFSIHRQQTILFDS